jgi:hypothetical protein
MRNRFAIGLLLSALCASTAVHAQFGIPRVRVPKIPGADKIKPSTPPPPSTPSPEQPSASGRLGCDVNDAVMDKLLKQMDAERAERDAALKDAASAKSPVQFEQCRMEQSRSPEGLQIAQKLGDLPDNASPDETQRAMMKSGEEMQALVARKCGGDPYEARDNLNKRFDAAAQRGREADRCYPTVQEHAIAFCNLPESDQAAAVNDGISTPGSGSNIFWVFTAAEAQAYKPRCSQILAAEAALDQQNVQKKALLDRN